MARTDPPVLREPVGIPEIAARLGVNRQTVDNWRQRPTSEFPPPEPNVTIGGRPVWQWAAVEEWAARTGRL